MIHAPASTKNQHRPRDPEMQATRKGQQVYFGMKAPMGVDAHRGIVPHVQGTAANVSDVTGSCARVTSTIKLTPISKVKLTHLT